MNETRASEGQSAIDRPPFSLWPGFRRTLPGRLIADHAFAIGAMIALIVVLAAILGPMLSPYPPDGLDFGNRFIPPSLYHPFGTDHFGRDVLTRVLYGARVSIWIGIGVAIAAALGGVLFGSLAGYFQRIDGPIMRVMDALMAFPAVLLALGIAAALGPKLINVIIALSIAYIPRTARIVRASVLTLKSSEFVDAARVANATDAWIIRRHILPNAMGPLIIQLSFVFAYAILAESALSFLGVGPPPPTPTWGNIISEGRDYVVEAWWIAAFPGLTICITVLGLNLLGDGMYDVLDPKLKVEA